MLRPARRLGRERHQLAGHDTVAPPRSRPRPPPPCETAASSADASSSPFFVAEFPRGTRARAST